MVSTEDCPSMADVEGGKLYREQENQSSEERDRVRKKAKARADDARTKWSETSDNSNAVETGSFGDGVGADGAISPVDASMLDAGDKTAEPAATLPG